MHEARPNLDHNSSIYIHIYIYVYFAVDVKIYFKVVRGNNLTLRRRNRKGKKRKKRDGGAESHIKAIFLEAGVAELLVKFGV